MDGESVDEFFLLLLFFLLKKEAWKDGPEREHDIKKNREIR